MSLRGWLDFLGWDVDVDNLRLLVSQVMVDAANGHSLWPKTQFHLPPYLRVILCCMVSIQRVHITCPMQLHENQQRVRIRLELFNLSNISELFRRIPPPCWLGEYRPRLEIDSGHWSVLSVANKSIRGEPQTGNALASFPIKLPMALWRAFTCLNIVETVCSLW